MRCPQTEHFSAVCWKPEYCKAMKKKYNMNKGQSESASTTVIKKY